MTRLKQAWLALWGKLPERVEPSTDPNDGPLFGLSPPEGCTFRVLCHRGQSWQVVIERGDEELARGCSLIDRRWGDGATDEKLIVRAAEEALSEHSAVSARAHLEGIYPPKVAKGRGE